MRTVSKYRAVNLRRTMAILIVAVVFLTGLPGIKNDAQAGKGSSFLGGMVAGSLIKGAVERDKERTQAIEHQSYSQPRPVQQAPAPAPQPSAEARIKELDKLAAGGYITPEEYQAKKKAILDGM